MDAGGYDERAPPSLVEILRPKPGDIVTIQDGRS